MKRYRYITLSLLLLLLSLSTLSAQDENEPYPLYTENYEYTFFAIITPTYCQKDGLVRITLATSPEYFDPENVDPEHIRYNPSEIKTVEYQLKDAEGNIYTTQSYKVTAPGDTVTIGQLEEGQYSLHVKITPKDGSKPPFEGDTSYGFYVQSRYQAMTPIHDPSYEWIDKYRLKCRTDGTFWITVQASTYRPPVVELVSYPSTYQGPRIIQPSSVEDYGYGPGLFSFHYKGNLPQGTYEYVLRNACEQTEPEKFVVYGPSSDLPTAVPADLSVSFQISSPYSFSTSRASCSDKVLEFGSVGTEGVYSLFETINKGYNGDPNIPFPEYVDSFQTIFNRNYEVLVITQKQQELLDQGRLDPNTLSWSSQKGSLTRLHLTQQEKDLPNIYYKLPSGLTIKELKTQKALPAALLIRVKQPNEGSDDYITIPIKMSLDYEKKTFDVRNIVAESDCGEKLGVLFQGKNFCSVQFKYYVLGAGEEKPATTATPVHISDPFGPVIGYFEDKYYSFAGYDPTKRYYVELVGTDLYGDPIPTASLVLPSSSGGTSSSSNRLYDSRKIGVKWPYPMLDLDKTYKQAAYLNTVCRMNLYSSNYSGKFGFPFAGMEITLVRAPEGYEDYQKTREDFYYRKPNPRNVRDPYGGGMIRLGETVKVSSEFKSSSEKDLRLFGFLYKEENGQRVIYPFRYGSEKDAAPRKDSWSKDSEKEEYMKAHPMPRGIYRFKFEHPCQPGEAFYINVNTDIPDFTPKLTTQIEPVVDYSSCDEVRIYPFADGRLDYAVNEKGIPHNLAFTVTTNHTDKKDLYFFPYDANGKPVDYTKFFIPIKRSQLPAQIDFEYKILKPEEVYTYYERKDTPTMTMDSVGICSYIEKELTGIAIDNATKLPEANFDPSIYQSDWGKSGCSYANWQLFSYDKPITVTVQAGKTTPDPSYIRRSYVGYRCKDRSSGYIEFKLVDIPNNSGLLILRERKAVNGVKPELLRQKIEDLTDMTARWHINEPSGNVLKDEYELVIRTVPCGQDPSKAQESYYPVRLLDIADVLRATISPSRGLCPGETVKLTGPNLGISDDNYVWTFYDFEGRASTPIKGRTVSHQVSAPRVRSDKTIWYDTYKLTVSGLECGEQSVTGIIPVSPDELWWMPQSDKIVDQMYSVAPWEDVDIDVILSATLPVATKQSQATLRKVSSGKGVFSPVSPLPNGPAGIKVDPGVLAARETYDWNNPDNWLFLHEGQFYRAQAVPSSCTHVHIVRTLYQDEANKSVWAPAPDLSPKVTLRDDFGEPTCADITFHSGAEVYDIPQLTYQRAMVRYNFGVNKNASGRNSATFGNEGDYASDLRIYTSQENFASDVRLYMRDSLYLLAAPLYDIYAGDYSFSASPYTYQLGFKAVPAGNNTVATFDASAFNDPSPLQSISMAGNHNSIGLVVANDEQGFKSREGKSAIMERRGILELPYFDRPDVAKPFYHQTYDASTGQSRFQYFDGKAKRFRSYYSHAQRSKMAYRFIFEDPNTQRIPKLSTGEEGYKLEVDFGTPAQEVMVGNPFMSTIDLKDFLEANKETLQPYARQMRAKVTSYQTGQPRLALTGKVTTFYSDASSVDGRYVAPLSAFVVKAKEGVGPKVELIFPKTIVPIGTQTQQKKPLRSATVAPTATTLRYLSLTLQSLLGKDRALIAYGSESGSVDKMLLSSDGSYPSIAIIDPADGFHKDLYADDASTGHYQLATQVSEPIDVTLSLAGSVMGHIVTARLIDHKSGLEHDLTGGKSCQIKLFPDDAEGRLELRVDGDFTSVAPMAEPTDELQAQYSEGMLTVRTTQEMSSLRLVQGDGITVYTQSLPGLTEYSERILLSSGSYVVEAVGTDGVARRAMLVVR